MKECPTCPVGVANSANFGGQCDACDAKRKMQNAGNMKALREAGRTDLPEYRALKRCGY